MKEFVMYISEELKFCEQPQLYPDIDSRKQSKHFVTSEKGGGGVQNIMIMNLKCYLFNVSVFTIWSVENFWPVWLFGMYKKWSVFWNLVSILINCLARFLKPKKSQPMDVIRASWKEHLRPRCVAISRNTFGFSYTRLQQNGHKF